MVNFLYAKVICWPIAHEKNREASSEHHQEFSAWCVRGTAAYPKALVCRLHHLSSPCFKGKRSTRCRTWVLHILIQSLPTNPESWATAQQPRHAAPKALLMICTRPFSKPRQRAGVWAAVRFLHGSLKWFFSCSLKPTSWRNHPFGTWKHLPVKPKQFMELKIGAMPGLGPSLVIRTTWPCKPVDARNCHRPLCAAIQTWQLKRVWVMGQNPGTSTRMVP